MNTDCGQMMKKALTPETENVSSERIIMEICESVDTIVELSRELCGYINQHIPADNPDLAIMNCQIEQINSLAEFASLHSYSLMYHK